MMKTRAFKFWFGKLWPGGVAARVGVVALGVLWLALSSLALPCRAAAPLKGRALIVGVDHYVNIPGRDLRFCERDAASLRDVLVNPQRGIFQPAQVRLLTSSATQAGKQSNRKAILDGLNWLAQAGRDEIVLFYFSGHGVIGPRGESCLMGRDAKLEDVARTSVPVGEVNRRLNSGGKALQKVVILDSCHSGTHAFAQEVSRARRINWRQVAAPAVGTQLAVGTQAGAVIDSLMSDAYGRATLSSCDQGEQSYEDPARGHSVFTYFLVKGLQGAGDINGDGMVDVAELHVYVSGQVSDWARDNDTRQTPRCQGNFSRIVLTRAPKRVVTRTPPGSIEVQLFQPQWTPSAAANQWVIPCAPNASVPLIGLAESPKGINSVQLDGKPLLFASLKSKDLALVRLPQTRTSRPTPSADLNGERSMRFESALRSGSAPSQVTLSVVDGSGARRDLRLVLQPNGTDSAERPAVAVIGVTRNGVEDFPELRAAGVGQGLQQRLTRAVADTGRFALVEEKSEVLRGLVEEDDALTNADRVRASRLLGAQFLLYAEVQEFAAPRSNRGKVFISLQVKMVDVQTGAIRGLGNGEAEVAATPSESRATEFSRTTLSRASDAAMRAALAELLRRSPGLIARLSGGSPCS